MSKVTSTANGSRSVSFPAPIRTDPSSMAMRINGATVTVEAFDVVALGATRIAVRSGRTVAGQCRAITDESSSGARHIGSRS